MVEPVNLRQFRKQKQRQDKERQADENRNLFGRTKAERTFALRQKHQNDLTQHSLSGESKSLVAVPLKEHDD